MNTEKLTALLRFKNDSKHPDNTKRLVARGGAMAHGLLDSKGNLKSEYTRLVSTMVELQAKGGTTESICNLVLKTYKGSAK